MSSGPDTEGLLRELAPQVLGVVVRRHGDFAAAEDAVQEALLAAAGQWPHEGRPDNPLGWLVRVASRRLVDQLRSDGARRRREDLAASWSVADPDPAPGRDDTLILMFMCCHPALTPASAVPLILRAVGGLTTREIAAAFLVPESTMAQRISRAKAKVRDAGARFRLPSDEERTERLQTVLRVLYLLFNEGYATSAGTQLTRRDLSGEAIRLARAVHDGLPDDPEVAGLLALMLLTDARRAARTGADGELVAMADQDRSRWDRDLIVEGLHLMTGALAHRAMGEYQLQAAIAGIHAEAQRHEDTDWARILALYDRLEHMTANPMVTLNRAVAAAMAQGPAAGLAVLDGLDERLGDHHRLHAVRGHLLEMSGDRRGAIVELRAAAAGAANQREQQYLTTQAARLAAGVERSHP
ncbi:MAG: polymerase sigma factor [Acidimicrobiales bacterium]|nr:polymerase sigma factor [Acidimicrobiales bacterium]